MTNQSLAKRGQVMPAEHGAADVASVTNRVALIQQVYKNIMQPDVHYGVIPGTPKPSLWKPGAEVVLMSLNAAATFPAERVFRVLEKDFVMYEITAAIKSNGSQEIIAEGIGLCSSREDKYAYRKGVILCPDCGKPAVFKSSNGPGWYCWTKKEGCGKKWPSDTAFDKKDAGKIPNPNIWEQANTILKMAEKRALVAAVLNLGASDIFTQDIEDFVEVPKQSSWGGSGSKEAQQAVAQEKLAQFNAQAEADLADIDEQCKIGVDGIDALSITGATSASPGLRGTIAPDSLGQAREIPIGPDQGVSQPTPRPSVATTASSGGPVTILGPVSSVVSSTTHGARPAADPRTGRYLYPEQAEHLKLFAKAKKAIGSESYYRCLRFNTYEKSTQIRTNVEGECILVAMREIAAAQAKTRKLKSDQAKAEMDAASLLPSREGSGCPIHISNQIATCIKKLGTPWEEANMAMQTQISDMRKEYPHVQDSDHWSVILVGLQDVLKRREQGQ